MKKHSPPRWLVAAFTLLMFHLPALAEDIDLFVGLPPSAANAPNVLIVLDNTANWNTAFAQEMAALKTVVSTLPADKFNIGLMLFTETGAGNTGSDGAYVRAAVRLMDAANKVKYQALVNGLDKTADKGNAGKVGKAMEEAYLYFAGLAPHSGNSKNKTDYTGNASGTAASNAIYALTGNALSTKAGSPYASPVSTGSCAKNFIIYISNGAAQDNTSDIAQATAALIAAGGSTATIPISPSGSQDNVADEWARFMKASSLGIVTYTIDINKVATGQGPGWSALMKSMAGVSTGKYFDVASGETGDEIVAALNKILSEIQTVNSVFASVSLPVSVNTQGTYLNQVYIGMFRPDQYTLPRWTGNLKQYKLGMIGNTLKLLDANSNGAINAQTGFIGECARSFWTPATADSYWAFNPMGTCLTVADSKASNYPDGNIVEKGAQAYMLRSTTARTVYTCSATFASCTDRILFNTTNVTPAMLGAADETEQVAIINWTKGLDVNDERTGDGVTPTPSGSPTTSTVMRPSAHGDVVHSRPVAIDYRADAASDPEVVVYYGGNDGVLRAVNGNRSASIGSVTAGSELWSFVAPEFYSNLKRIRDNSVTISFPGQTAVTPTPLPKTYAFDGPIAAFKDATRAWIYASMRRGGRALYAFDVSDPIDPSLKWKIGCPNAANDTDCTVPSGVITGIGQTWSQPKVIKSALDANRPMLIMGGGYDTCEDADPNSCSAGGHSKKGNHIYVLDADTGAHIKTFDTERSVIADVTVAPDSAGLIRYAYAVDTGGNIYRISGSDANTPIGVTPPGSWTITRIASLGCADATTACNPNRKFMFAPDGVEDSGIFYLMVGSGDREKPLNDKAFPNSNNVSNYFFMVKDKPTDAAWLSSENGNCGTNKICLASLLLITPNDHPSVADVDEKKGWYLELAKKTTSITDPDSGITTDYITSEQVVTSAITIFDVVTFSTHQPAVPTPGACGTNLGTTQVYNINYANAASANGTDSRFKQVVGGGLPPSPVAGMVKLDDTVDKDGNVVPGEEKPFCIGCDESSPLEGKPPISPASVLQPKSRVYWYIQ